MKLVQLIEFLRNRLKTVVWVCCGTLALVTLVDIFFVSKEHAHTAAERLVPGFWSIYGFVGCVVIILASKWYGHLGIMTREDYYDEKQPAPAPEESHHE